MVMPIYEQEDFRFRNDDGDLASATPMSLANNVDQTIEVDTNFRCRIVVKQTMALMNVNDQAFQIRAMLAGGVWGINDFQVTNVSNVVRLVNDGNGIPDHATTVQRIGDGSYSSGDCEGYNDGTVSNWTGYIDFNGCEEAEIEFCAELVGVDLNDEDEIDFRVYLATGIGLDVYPANLPTVKADKDPESTSSPSSTAGDSSHSSSSSSSLTSSSSSSSQTSSSSSSSQTSSSSSSSVTSSSSSRSSASSSSSSSGSSSSSSRSSELSSSSSSSFSSSSSSGSSRSSLSSASSSSSSRSSSSISSGSSVSSASSNSSSSSESSSTGVKNYPKTKRLSGGNFSAVVSKVS